VLVAWLGRELHRHNAVDDCHRQRLVGRLLVPYFTVLTVQAKASGLDRSVSHGTDQSITLRRASPRCPCLALFACAVLTTCDKNSPGRLRRLYVLRSSKTRLQPTYDCRHIMSSSLFIHRYYLCTVCGLRSIIGHGTCFGFQQRTQRIAD